MMMHNCGGATLADETALTGMASKTQMLGHEQLNLMWNHLVNTTLFIMNLVQTGLILN